MSKPGRPVDMMSHKRGSNFSVYFDEQQIENIDDIRWRERKSRSEMVRIAVDEYIKNHKDGNNIFKLDSWQQNPEFQAVPALLSNLDVWRTFILEHTSREEATKIITQCNRIRDFVSIKWDREREKKND